MVKELKSDREEREVVVAGVGEEAHRRIHWERHRETHAVHLPLEGRAHSES